MPLLPITKLTKLVPVLILLGFASISIAQGDTWAARADMPTPRIGHSSCTINSKIYVIGGRPGLRVDSALDTVEEYDPATDSWTVKSDMPAPRQFLSASAVNGKCYAIGGQAVNIGPTGLNNVAEYDPVTDSWQSKAPMPVGRVAHSSAVVGGKIYVMGGITHYVAIDLAEDTWSGTTYATVEEYDPETDSWATRTDMPEVRAHVKGSGSVVDGRIYVIGGARTGEPHPGLSTNEEYTPPFFQDYDDRVQKMYIAYYGRPGDPGGIDFWAGRLQENGGDLSDIINEFGTSGEFTDRYGGLANEELVNNIYLQLFGRGADPEGLEFYVGWLLEGIRSLGDIALAIADGVQEGTDDFDIVSNKLEVANTFSTKVVECDASYGAEEINGAMEIINSVDSSEASVEIALPQIDAFLCE